MKIVGLFMVRNEDVYIEQAIRNVADFCDVIYVDDNGSTDGTLAIVERLAAEFEHIHVRVITDTRQSNDNIVQYFDTDTWIFAVDGDELYDSDGLVELRRRMESGEFSEDWLLFGNCLHVTKISDDRTTATGFLAPPSESMTKLYNFSLISDFPITDERLHGIPVFKDGGDSLSKWNELHRTVAWEESCFRCLHVAFVKRTSKPAEQTRVLGVRLNPPQIYSLKKIWRDHPLFYAAPRAAYVFLEIVLGRDERVRRYRVGGRQRKDVRKFFEK